MVSTIQRKPHLHNYAFQVSGKATTKADAATWGRIAAALGWGLSRLEAEVQSEFHDVAIASYERRLVKLRYQQKQRLNYYR